MYSTLTGRVRERTSSLNHVVAFDNRASLSGEAFFGAVLFADISGFSQLGESLVKKCHGNHEKAAEELSGCIGRNLDKMVYAITNHGGDIVKFAGGKKLFWHLVALIEYSGAFRANKVQCRTSLP